MKAAGVVLSLAGGSILFVAIVSTIYMDVRSFLINMTQFTVDSRFLPAVFVQNIINATGVVLSLLAVPLLIAGWLLCICFMVKLFDMIFGVDGK